MWEEFGDKNLLRSDFDQFIFGCDQVWNPIFGLNLELSTLSFAEPNKSVACAASFGTTVAREDFDEAFVVNLEPFSHISVREYETADVIEILLGRRPPIVLDPTLLVEQEFMINLASEEDFRLPANQYAFVFTLSKAGN